MTSLAAELDHDRDHLPVVILVNENGNTQIQDGVILALTLAVVVVFQSRREHNAGKVGIIIKPCRLIS